MDFNLLLNKSVWDTVAIKLYDFATKRDKAVAALLPACRVVIEVLNTSVINGGSSEILTAPKVSSQSPPPAACDTAPKRGGGEEGRGEPPEVMDSTGGQEVPEVTSSEITSSEVTFPEMTTQEMTKVKIEATTKTNPEAVITKVNMQIQDEGLISEDEFALSLQDLNKLSSADKQKEINVEKKKVL